MRSAALEVGLLKQLKRIQILAFDEEILGCIEIDAFVSAIGRSEFVVFFIGFTGELSGFSPASLKR